MPDTFADDFRCQSSWDRCDHRSAGSLALSGPVFTPPHWHNCDLVGQSTPPPGGHCAPTIMVKGPLRATCVLDEPTTGLDPEQRLRFREPGLGGARADGAALHPPGRRRGRPLLSGDRDARGDDPLRRPIPRPGRGRPRTGCGWPPSGRARPASRGVPPAAPTAVSATLRLGPAWSSRRPRTATCCWSVKEPSWE